jgi:hypothetical protein
MAGIDPHDKSTLTVEQLAACETMLSELTAA